MNLITSEKEITPRTPLTRKIVLKNRKEYALFARKSREQRPFDKNQDYSRLSAKHSGKHHE